MADPAAFAKLVPGFDFLQGLVRNAGSAMPSMGHWIAPTLDPEELDKRISELRTVQFWLEQNARMLAATIQALEVQRMTLSTLQTMNVSLGDLTESLKIRVPEPAPAEDEAEPEAPAPATAAPPAASGKPAKKASRRAKGGATASAATAGVPDPMQWWGALTKQFAELATNAMKDGAAEAANRLAAAAADGTPAKKPASPDAPTETAAALAASLESDEGGASPSGAARKPSARKR